MSVCPARARSQQAGVDNPCNPWIKIIHKSTQIKTQMHTNNQ